jgi:hypothetical protein
VARINALAHDSGYVEQPLIFRDMKTSKKLSEQENTNKEEVSA